jgi:hypothetical protein
VLDAPRPSRVSGPELRMATIHGSRSVAGPPSPVSWKRREYLSPDRQWNVVYHTPTEWFRIFESWATVLLGPDHRRVTSSVRSLGLSLDTWHDVRFHQPSATLYLSVYRPISPVYGNNDERLCKVEERLVAVELGT